MSNDSTNRLGNNDDKHEIIRIEQITGGGGGVGGRVGLGLITATVSGRHESKKLDAINYLIDSSHR